MGAVTSWAAGVREGRCRGWDGLGGNSTTFLCLVDEYVAFYVPFDCCHHDLFRCFAETIEMMNSGDTPAVARSSIFLFSILAN